MSTTTAPAVTLIRADEGEVYSIIGEKVIFKVTQADTNGAYSIFEMVAQPGGGPPLHTHLSSESFHVLEGEIEFSTLEDGVLKSVSGKAGDTIFVPAGAMHTYSAFGNAPCRTVSVLVPGGDMEAFFREAGTRIEPGQPEPGGAPDIPAMLAVAARHGLEFAPPPGEN